MVLCKWEAPSTKIGCWRIVERVSSLACDSRKRQALINPVGWKGSIWKPAWRWMPWMPSLPTGSRDRLCYPTVCSLFAFSLRNVPGAATALKPLEILSLWLGWHQGNLLSFLRGRVSSLILTRQLHSHQEADPAFLWGTPVFPLFPGRKLHPQPTAGLLPSHLWPSVCEKTKFLPWRLFLTPG